MRSARPASGRPLARSRRRGLAWIWAPPRSRGHGRLLHLLIFVLEEAEDEAVMVSIVEEDRIPDPALFPEADLFCEGKAPFVFRVGPPADAMEVELLECLLQQQVDDFGPVSLSPSILLPDREADIGRGGP